MGPDLQAERIDPGKGWRRYVKGQQVESPARHISKGKSPNSMPAHFHGSAPWGSLPAALLTHDVCFLNASKLRAGFEDGSADASYHSMCYSTSSVVVGKRNKGGFRSNVVEFVSQITCAIRPSGTV